MCNFYLIFFNVICIILLLSHYCCDVTLCSQWLSIDLLIVNTFIVAVHFQRGSLIKVMDGEGVGCSGLHLARGDSILIGQVIDDFALRFARLQVRFKRN